MVKKRKRGERGKRGWTQKRILLLMAKKNQSISVNELRQILDLDKSTVHTHLTRLEQKNMVENVSDGWILYVSKPLLDLPYDYTRQENLRHHHWINSWFSAGWTKGQSDELSKTMWYKKYIKPYWNKSPFEANFENDFINWINKAFELAEKYPDLWKTVSFKIEKKSNDPLHSLSYFIHPNIGNKKKIPDKLW